MASVLLLFCVSWFALAAAWSAAPGPYALEEADQLFEHFLRKYKKNYADANEKQKRFQIFKENLENINNLNEKSKHAVFGITQFSDLRQEEFNSKMTCLRPLDKLGLSDYQTACKYVYDEDIDYNDAPESFDWREHDAVTPIKSQELCGSCYAFSTIGNIEGQYAIKHKELVRLSEQQIVDCDEENYGCNGGYMSVAMRSLINQGGSESEADYPYTGKKADCSFNANNTKVEITDCRSYNLTSQEKLKQVLVNVGPISLGIRANGLMYYIGGILSDEKCNDGYINHGVLLVGYGSENGEPYWIAKNSWGPWGEDGYFRFQRGEDATSCGIMNDLMASAIIT